MKQIIAVILLTLALGCATTPQKGQLKTFDIPYSEQEDIEIKFQEVIDFCTPRLSTWESKAESQATKAFWVNISGLVAGAVIVPALVAAQVSSTFWMATQAGLAGWAGSNAFVGNTLQAAGLSGAEVATMRNEIVERIRDKSAVVLDGKKSYTQRRNALMGIVGECTIYPMVVPGWYGGSQ